MKTNYPRKTDAIISIEKRRELIKAARKYIGVRWLHVGRDNNGLDCAGLIIAVIQDVFGIDIQVYDYSPWPRPAVMRDICNAILRPIRREDMQPGDVALLYAPGLGVVHLGLFTGKTLIHASNAPGVQKVVETTIHPNWLLRGAFAVPVYGGY